MECSVEDPITAFTRCIDLTTLNRDTDTDAVVQALCQQACEFDCAAVCVYPEFVRTAIQHTSSSSSKVRVASVANFPSGNQPLQDVLQEVDLIIRSGGHEVDLVLPYERFKRGDEAYCREVIRAVRARCDESMVLLKLIIESGELSSVDLIRRASRLCIECGADFIKTSTGKSSVSATPEAARVMLEEIVAANKKEDGKRTVGFKASGGIKTIPQALVYSNLVRELLGEPVHPSTFRIGASSLLNEVKQHLSHQE